MIVISLWTLGTLLTGAVSVGCGLGIRWVRSHRVVLDRDVHISFLRTLKARNARIDELLQQVEKMKSAGLSCPIPHPTTPIAQPLRIWTPNESPCSF